MRGFKACLCTLLAALVMTAAAPALAVTLPPAFAQGDTRSIVLGDGIAFALQADGTLWGWGGGTNFGLLGTGGSYDQVETGIYGPIYSQNTPKLLLEDVAQVTTGTPYACPFTVAVGTDGSLWYTGQDTDVFTRLADGVTGACCWERWDPAAAGKIYHDIYAVRTDGGLWRYTLEMAMEDDGSQRAVGWRDPEKLMDGVAQISTGYQHALVRKTDGSVWAWGDYSKGQLGDGRRSDEEEARFWSNTPVKVMDGAVSVLASWDFSAAIQGDGSLWVWGDAWGTAQTRPVKLADQVSQIHHNPSYVALVKEDGSLWIWGNPSRAVAEGMGDCSAAPVSTGITGVRQAVSSNSGPLYGLYYIREDGSLWVQGWSYGEEITYVTCQVTGQETGQTAAPAFADVPQGAYYAQAVGWAVEKGITTGTGPSTFSPDSTCSTAEILTFLWRAVGSPAPDGASPFPDVAEGAYYAQAAAWAREQGLVSGASFQGDRPATRSDTVTYLWKLAGSPAAPAAPFDDVPAGADYAAAVAWAVQEGITTGTGDTTFDPDAICTRGQIMTFLYRDLA